MRAHCQSILSGFTVNEGIVLALCIKREKARRNKHQPIAESEKQCLLNFEMAPEGCASIRQKFNRKSKVSTSNMHLPFWLAGSNSELGVFVILYQAPTGTKGRYPTSNSNKNTRQRTYEIVKSNHARCRAPSPVSKERADEQCKTS